MNRSIGVLLFCMIALGAFVPAGAQPEFSAPVLITSAGQSADVTMAGMLCKKVGVKASTLPQATANDLGDAGTLMIVPGFSSKGLGAAGISREEELDRVGKVIKAAKKKKLHILLLHLGGKARRGPQSDDFNRMAAEASSMMIVVRQGDEDGFFSDIAKKKKIPLELVDKIAATTTPIKNLFK